MPDYQEKRWVEFSTHVLPHIHVLPIKAQALIVRYYLISPLSHQRDIARPEVQAWIEANHTAIIQAFEGENA